MSNASDELQVYCSSCLRKIHFSSLRPFECPYRGADGCPMPYKFEVFENEQKAREQYASLDSWMPKILVRPEVTWAATPHPTYWCVAYNDAPVGRFSIRGISEIVHPSTLLLLESGFAAEIESAVAIIEPEGTRLEKVEPIPGMGERLSIPRSCADYCKLIRTTFHNATSGNQLCINFDQSVVERLKERKDPKRLLVKQHFDFDEARIEAYAYICWGGLVDYAVPIFVEGNLIAVVFSGQWQLAGGQGQKYLSQGIARISQKLGIPVQDLQAAALGGGEAGRVLSLRTIKKEHLPEIANVGREVSRIARAAYAAKRQERDGYFLREITHIIESGHETTYGIKPVDKTLHRLQDYFGLEEAYFFISSVDDPEVFEVVAKATAPNLTTDEKDFSVRLDDEELRAFDRIAVFELVGKDRYEHIVQKLQSLCPNLKLENVYMGTCPLAGGHNAFWLFINPFTIRGFRGQRGLTLLDTHFLSQFCVSVRDVVGKGLASSIVMRSIGHALGAGFQSIITRERAIAAVATESEVKDLTQKNLAQIHKYHYLVENLRNMFIRRGRETYVFKKHGITRPVMEVCEICLHDDELERRAVTLRKPTLRGSRTIEMDLPSMTIAIYNLVQNAIKYSFDKHYIEIKGEESKGKDGKHLYRLGISNFGVGITPEEIAGRLIFLQDYRGVLARDRNRSGTGLGLSIVERVINLHGGYIAVSSISAIEIAHLRKHGRPIPESARARLIKPGQDLEFGYLTTFTVYLPYTQDEGEYYNV